MPLAISSGEDVVEQARTLRVDEPSAWSAYAVPKVRGLKMVRWARVALREEGSILGENVLGGQYEVLRQVQASLGAGRVKLGTKGLCRFCGTTDRSRFRTVAHTFPEALGNRWVVSLDECDDCNAKFSIYDDALANSVGAFLTLGGTKGKGGQVRQTGRTKGDAVVTRHEGHGLPRISAINIGADFGDQFRVDPTTGRLQMVIRIPGVRFRPRHAYKGLCKMGVALLPNEELDNFRQLRGWLLDPQDSLDFPFLDVALSFGSVGNAPPLAVGTLLRRMTPDAAIPHMLFVFCAGSVCAQIDLMPDDLDHHLPPTVMGGVNIRWSNALGGTPAKPAVKIDYGDPVHLDWSTAETRPQPIAAMLLDFDPVTTAGQFTPIFRV
jgi:hypothetical protein